MLLQILIYLILGYTVPAPPAPRDLHLALAYIIRELLTGAVPLPPRTTAPAKDNSDFHSNTVGKERQLHSGPQQAQALLFWETRAR